MMGTMIFDAISYREYALKQPKSPRREMILSFLSFIESRLGMVAMYPLSGIPRGRLELVDPFAIAQKLKQKGIIKSFKRNKTRPDEPPYRLWQCLSEDSLGSKTSGMSLASDADALYAALAEGLERYLWLMQWDYFDSPVHAKTSEMAARGVAYIAPERFSGFQDSRRSGATSDDPYTWILGDSLVSGKKMYIPAQTASGAQFPGIKDETLFRERSTNGLATWPTRDGARLAGMLEIIERDAYMIMWLNQLSPSKIALDTHRAQSPSLNALIEECALYRLKVHALALPTDAPTYAVCVVVEDLSDVAPRFALGLKAHRSLAVSIEKALLEALRARVSYRSSDKEIAAWNTDTPANKVGHKDRLFYWGLEKHAHQLEFLISGTEKEYTSQVWENDSAEQHLARLLEWCRRRSYECIAVPLGKSVMNPTQWHVESVVMPDLQWMHLSEKSRVITGKRLTEVPRALGLSPRLKPFVDAPHPFY